MVAEMEYAVALEATGCERHCGFESRPPHTLELASNIGPEEQWQQESPKKRSRGSEDQERQH